MGKSTIDDLLDHPLVDKFLVKLHVSFRLILKLIGCWIIAYFLMSCGRRISLILAYSGFDFMQWAIVPSLVFFIILFIAGPYYCLINKGNRVTNFRQVLRFSFFPLVLWSLFFIELEFDFYESSREGLVFIPLLQFTQYLGIPYNTIDHYINITRDAGMCPQNADPGRGWNDLFWAFKASFLLIIFIIYHARRYREIVSYQKWIKVFFISYLVFFLIRSQLFSLALIIRPEHSTDYKNCNFTHYFSIVLPWGPDLSKDHCSYIGSC